MNRLNDVMSEISSLCLHILPAESNPILQFSFNHRLMANEMPGMATNKLTSLIVKFFETFVSNLHSFVQTLTFFIKNSKDL